MFLKTFIVGFVVITLLKTELCQGSSAFLLYTREAWHSEIIYKANIDSRGLLSGQPKSIISRYYDIFEAVTYDPITERMYWVESPSIFGSNYEIHSSFLNGSDERTVVTNLRTVVDLSVDIAGRNLYWADKTRGRIEVSRLDGSFRKVLLYVAAPTSMVLDLKTRVMFWSTYKNYVMKIEKASMDGSNRSVFFSNSLRNKPTGISIDVKQQILYWVERRVQKIHYLDLTSSNSPVRSIATTSGNKPFRVANIGQRIYWTDRGNNWGRGKIGSLNTTSGSDIRIMLNINTPRDIYAYDPNQPYYSKTKCGVNKGGCEHLCLQSPQKDMCVCTHGMILNDDGKTCHFREFLLAADDHYKKIFYKSLDDLSHPRKALPLGQTGYINTVDYDPLDKKVYWTDNKGRTSRAYLNGSSIERLIDSSKMKPSGHAIDVIGRNLYWYDGTNLNIGVSKLDGSYTKALVKLTIKPVALALDSKHGYIYWVHFLGSRKITIKRSQMNGTNQEDVIGTWRSSTHYVKHVWLAFDSETNRLYFHDEYDILYTDTKPLSGVAHALSLPSWIFPVSGLAVKESFIYWGDWLHEKVYRVNKTSLKNIKSIASVIDPIDLHVYHNYTDTPDDFHPCAQYNGWCTHLCLLNPDGYSCVCPTNTGSRICYTTPVVPSRSRTHPSSTSTIVAPRSSSVTSSPAAHLTSTFQVVSPSSSTPPSIPPVISSVFVVVASSSMLLSSSVHTASSTFLLPSSSPRPSSLRVSNPSTSSFMEISSSTPVQTSSVQAIVSSSSHLSSPAHKTYSTQAFPFSSPHPSSLRHTISSMSSSLVISSSTPYQKSSCIQLFPSSSEIASSTLLQLSSFVASSPYISTPAQIMSSIQLRPSSSPVFSSIHHQMSSFSNVMSSSSNPSSSSQHSHSSLQIHSLSSLHPFSSHYHTSSSEVLSLSLLHSSSSLALLPLTSFSSTRATPLYSSSPVFFPQVSSTTPLVLSSSVFMSTSSPLLSTTAQSSRTYRKSSTMVSPTPSLIFTSQLFQPSSSLSMTTTTSPLKITTTKTSSLLAATTTRTSLSSSTVTTTRASSSLLMVTTEAASSPSPMPTSRLTSSSTTSIRPSSSSLLAATSTTSSSPSAVSKIRKSSATTTTPPPLFSTTLISSSKMTTTTSSSRSSSSTTQRPEETPSSVKLTVRPTTTIPTTISTPPSPTTKPTCAPMYFGADCKIFIGENKMALTLRKNGKRLSEKSFKFSVSGGITKYCEKDSCIELLRSSQKTKRDTENKAKFTSSDILVLSSPIVFLTESEVLTIEFALMNPLAKGKVVPRASLCKLVSKSKEVIQDFLKGPQIVKLNPECDLYAVVPTAGEQKGGGSSSDTTTSVTISLSVLFVILLVLAIIYFAVRYMRNKEFLAKKQKTGTRSEFSFQNNGYLQDDTAFESTEPTFITPAHDNNRNITNKVTEKPSIGRQTAWDDLPNGISTGSLPHQFDHLEVHDYEQLDVTPAFPPSQEVQRRPFRYARLDPDTSLNHDYEALSPRRDESRGGMGTRRENDYAEVGVTSVGNPLYASGNGLMDRETISTENPLYGTGMTDKSADYIYDNHDIKGRGNPLHVNVSPLRLKDVSLYENNEVTSEDDTLHVDTTPRRLRDVSLFENREITNTDDTYVDILPRRSTGNAYENRDLGTPSDSKDFHVYDHLEGFNRQPSDHRDAADYDHLQRDHRKRAKDHQGRNQPANENHVLHIDGPDDKEETII